MDESFRPIVLLLALLNPFILSIYLMGIIRDLSRAVFFQVLLRGTLISWCVFSLFAWGGDKIFSDILQVSVNSFLIFGGILFIIIGLQFAFKGAESLQLLRGSPEHISGAIAMPFMIGPGSVSASILIGTRFPPVTSSLAILAVLSLTVLGLLALKAIHDYVYVKNDRIITRYVDIVGRLSALLIGTIAVEMIMRGLRGWMTGTSLG